MAQVFIEKVNSHLKYLNESSTVSGNTYIGKLAGIAADFTKPTRNGRRYPLKLWQNVEKSDDFKEMMATMTCFGEADHPSDESGRVDTSIKEVAVVLTKYEIRESEGVVYCEFLILDTPNGRIIKTLLDAGCKMGVSSRGIGDEVIRNGETIIDPDTYQFYGFDVVVMPAVVSARPTVVESKNRKRQRSNVGLVKSIRKEILEASTRTELVNISKMIDASKLPDMDSLKESINIRLRELNGRNNISSSSEDSKLKLENMKLKAQLLRLQNENKTMKARINADNIRLEELISKNRSAQSNTNSVCESLRSENVKLCRMVESKDEKIATITKSQNDKYNSVVAENRRIKAELAECKKSLNEANRQNDIQSRKVSVLYENINDSKKQNKEKNKLLECNIRSLESDVKTYHEQLVKQKAVNTELQNKVNSLTEALDVANKAKKLTESNKDKQMEQVQRQLNEAKNETAKTLSEYLKLRCLQENLDEQSVREILPKVCKISDIDRVVSELSDRKRRLDKVPIVLQPRTVALVESTSFNVTDEDKQTMAFLNAQIK